MEQILFVDACVRPQSRTRILAQRVLSHLTGEITRLDLNRENVMPLTRESLERRLALQTAGDFSDPMFDLAKQFAAADIIVIAAPYWDLSFPASLKAYIEAVEVVGLTFAYDEQEQPYGMCRAKELIYVTTAGGPILSDELGYGYLRALGKEFYHIPRIRQYKAQGLDLLGADVEGIMKKALSEIDRDFN